MTNRGVQEFYYTRTLPARAVAIAKIKTAAATPAQLTDVNNTPYQAGSRGVWRASSDLSGPADFVAADYGVPVAVTGSARYQVANQFFELTDMVMPDGTAHAGAPLFYRHQFSADVLDVKVLDLAGHVIDADLRLDREQHVLYHNLDGAPYRVRYVEDAGTVHVALLRYDPVYTRAKYSPSLNTYLFGGRTLEVLSSSLHLHIRFTRPNGYRVAQPYTSLPNAPWFARVGCSLILPSPEWPRQVFLPERPYMLGTWIPGTVLDVHLIEFERKAILDDPARRPDILVFDRDYQIKYALEGTAVGTSRRRGSVYRWKRGQVTGLDPYNARVEIALELAPDDVVYGFYSYYEPDVVYTALDLNPFTNPDVKNRVVRFYYRDDSDPFRVLYHQIVEADGTPVPGLTNDPAPVDPPPNVFAEMVVGANVGVPQIEVEDVRQRGGGLAPVFQGIPEAVNFWDLGYWDGKPYPIGAAVVVYLPSRLLETLSRDDVEGKVKAVMPLGVSVVVRYYGPDGEEPV